MEYEGRIIKVQGDEVTFKLDRDFDIAEAKRLSIEENTRSIIRVIDERNITKAQNGMIHGLFNDISLYTGYPQEWVKELLKAMFAGEKGIETFSLKNYEISQVFAGEFIEYILKFCFENEIPFKYQQFHLASDITRVLFLYLKHRACFVCGKPHADMAHYEAVGMGRNRKKIDHSKHRFMTLCREHHQEQHNIGLTEFMQKYVLVPIKLTPEQVKEFKIGG
ncbi:putative HNHc nuclease [Vagococcus lutrae]|uniref:putative HNHc nuclease n=1 Tax=Vagococcus lutrae TaxID=81947 RepID=UPI00200DB766|nr:putative HNHc nuclease [Vagococcus lutrae]UQF24239.1 putative HNHc nuclease [Vagococcus lutrae]UQF63671.1 putative HNHc nuclease [Vagococcus lutrae]